MSALISVIVPVYKVEAYLKKCVDSIINQTYKNLEIILVDDGSPDGCSKLCDKLAEEDKRIVVIHQGNKGVSSARNAGIDIAKGEYIMFVDGDDWLPRNAAEKLVCSITQNGADFCYGATKEIHVLKNRIPDNVPDTTIQKEDANNLLPFIQKMAKTPWGKLFRRRLLNDYHIRFDKDIKFHEDTIFLYRFLQKCQTLSSVSNITYYYNRLVFASASKKQYSEIHIWKYTTAYELEKIFADHLSQADIMKYVSQRYLLSLDGRCREIVSVYADAQEAIKRLRETCVIYKEKINSLKTNVIVHQDTKLDRIVSAYSSYINNDEYDDLYRYLSKSTTVEPESKGKTAMRNLLVSFRIFCIFKILK